MNRQIHKSSSHAAGFGDLCGVDSGSGNCTIGVVIERLPLQRHTVSFNQRDEITSASRRAGGAIIEPTGGFR